MSILYIFLAILAVFILWAVFAYNRFIALNNRTSEAWADIDVQLKRRYDLIPNLVETVKAYAKHEREVFENVTKARAEALNAGNNVAAHARAENMLTDALKSVFAVAEAYPDLKANQNFLELQRELSDTENKIQAARRFYNTNVRDINTAIQSFPNNLIANLFRFGTRDLFDLAGSADEREPVSVSF